MALRKKAEPSPPQPKEVSDPRETRESLTGVMTPPETAVPDPVVLESDHKGNVVNGDVDPALPTRNLIDGQLLFKVLTPDGRTLNGATGEEWTEADSVALYGEDAVVKPPEEQEFTEDELKRAAELLRQSQGRV